MFWSDLMNGLTWWVTPTRRERRRRSRALWRTRTPWPPPAPRPSPFTRAELDYLAWLEEGFRIISPEGIDREYPPGA